MTKVYSRIPPPPMKNFRFEMTKVYSRIPPKWKTSDLRWPKFTPEYPPPPNMKNFRFEMTKVYSGIPHQMKNFRFEMTKVYSGIPPPPSQKMKNFRFEMTKVYSGIPPPHLGLQSGRSSVETNLYPPWIPLVTACKQSCGKVIFHRCVCLSTVRAGWVPIWQFSIIHWTSLYSPPPPQNDISWPLKEVRLAQAGFSFMLTWDLKM